MYPWPLHCAIAAGQGSTGERLAGFVHMTADTSFHFLDHECFVSKNLLLSHRLAMGPTRKFVSWHEFHSLATAADDTHRAD
jgi:hypothetical protein